MNNRFQLTVGLLLVGLLSLTMAIYWSGLSGMFLVDDTYNLELLNQYGGVTDWKSFRAFVFDNPSGPLGRPVSMLSFLLNDQYYPGDVSSYRYTNLMIHCLCGLVMFWLTSKVLDQLFGVKAEHWVVALLASGWWLLAPINVSTTLYVIQRMAQLATLFSLLGLLLYVWGASLARKGEGRGVFIAFLGLYGLGLLALLSKENGALIFFYALAIELAMRAAGRPSPRSIVLLVSVPSAVIVGYMLYRWGFTADSSVRDFTNNERLLTQFRILWDYLAKSILPMTGKMGLVHDDYILSRSLFEPLTTIVALLCHLLLVFAAWRYRRVAPVLLFAVVWYYGGHLMESTVIPLELYFEHRNYMPIMAVYVAIVYGVWSGLGRQIMYRTLLLVVVLLSALVCAQRAIIWSKPFAQVKVWASEHPESVRAQTMFARSLLVKHDFESAHIELERLRVKWPDAIHLDFILLDQACRGNMPLTINMQSLSEKMKHARYHGSLVSVVENLMDSYREQRCDFVNSDSMHMVLQSIDGYKNVLRPVKAKFAYWDSHIYVDERKLGAALEAADRAFGHSATSAVLLYKANILASAGLFDAALHELELGFSIEARKPIHRRQLLDEMGQLQEKIIRAKSMRIESS